MSKDSISALVALALAGAAIAGILMFGFQKPTEYSEDNLQAVGRACELVNKHQPENARDCAKLVEELR